MINFHFRNRNPFFSNICFSEIILSTIQINLIFLKHDINRSFITNFVKIKMAKRFNLSSFNLTLLFRFRFSNYLRKLWTLLKK
jgi:hypothetical protein